MSLESKKIEWGIVGMGSMGINLSRNFASNGYSLALYNRYVKGKEEQIALKQKKKFPELKHALAFESLANFVSSINPASLGIIKTFLSLISSSPSCKEYKREFPSSEYSPLKGASRPILRYLLTSLLKRLELKNKII